MFDHEAHITALEEIIKDLQQITKTLQDVVASLTNPVHGAMNLCPSCDYEYNSESYTCSACKKFICHYCYSWSKERTEYYCGKTCVIKFFKVKRDISPQSWDAFLTRLERMDDKVFSASELNPYVR